MIEKIISASKKPAQKTHLDQTDQLIEFLSKVSFSFAANIIVVGFGCPKAVACIYTYCTTASGNDAFELSFAVW